MTDKTSASEPDGWDDDGEPGISLFELGSMLAAKWKLIAGSVVVAGAAGFGVASIVPPWFTARTVILPPQQQTSAATSAIAQLGALAGIAGGLGGMKSPADQYVALMQSTTVSDRIIDRFKLQSVYEEEYRTDTRKRLSENVRVSASKKDGLITVEVDDREPQRAAAIANTFIEELREMTNSLAVSEAQQRRVFFEQQLAQTKERLAKAQAALEVSGINQGALKVEPKTAAENYARLRAQATAAEVRLQTLRRMLAEGTPEVMQQQATLAALREQLARSEQRETGRGGSDYVDRYREFKYQEALFEIFVKQYELARVDESREGALIQVVDEAQTPEKKTGPRRSLIAAAVAFLALIAGCIYALSLGLRSLRKETAPR